MDSKLIRFFNQLPLEIAQKIVRDLFASCLWEIQSVSNTHWNLDDSFYLSILWLNYPLSSGWRGLRGVTKFSQRTGTVITDSRKIAN